MSLFRTPTKLKNCDKCLQRIPNRQHLTCCVCKWTYDLECAEVSLQRFLSTLTGDHRANWECDACIERRCRGDNIETPLRYRKKPHNDTLSSTDDRSILGETFTACKLDPEIEPEAPNCNNVSLEQLSILLDSKLEENNERIFQKLSEIKAIMRTEIDTRINTIEQQFLSHKTDIHQSQKKYQTEIEKINKKIEMLEYENAVIKQKFSEENGSNRPSILPLQNTEDNQTKKIVLYGLTDYDEDENELYQRLVRIFMDIQQVNLAGIVEDFQRIGKKGRKRPILIELLSKRATKYILQNKHYFKNTGLAIEEYLEKDQLKRRNKLREVLIEERKKGNYAVIRNNRLYIDNKEYLSTFDEKDADTVGKMDTRENLRPQKLTKTTNESPAPTSPETSTSYARPQATKFQSQSPTYKEVLLSPSPSFCGPQAALSLPPHHSEPQAVLSLPLHQSEPQAALSMSSSYSGSQATMSYQPPDTKLQTTTSPYTGPKASSATTTNNRSQADPSSTAKRAPGRQSKTPQLRRVMTRPANANKHPGRGHTFRDYY